MAYNLQMPKVSIVLPTYNGSRFIRQSIDSCLNQTYQNIELIIVDDCSTDNTQEIVKSYSDPRVHYVRNEKNLRLPNALNAGFDQAKGEYLTWTSDDNLYVENAIEQMVNFLVTQKADFVYCDIFTFKNDQISNAEYEELPDTETLPQHNCVRACFLYNRKVKEVVGDYDPDMELIEDYDYWVRVAKHFTLHHIRKPLYYYRYHEKSLWCSRINEIKVIENLFKLKHNFRNMDEVNWFLRELMFKNKGAASFIDKIMAKFIYKKEIASILQRYQERQISFTEARKSLSAIVNRNVEDRNFMTTGFPSMTSQGSHKKQHHYLFLRKLPPNGEWGGLEKLMIDWFERIDYQMCRVTIAVPSEWQGVFTNKIAEKALPVSVVSCQSIFEDKKIINNFFNMLALLKQIKPTATIFTQAWFSEIGLGHILAASLMTRGRVFMHENLGAPIPPEKLNKRYFGFLPALELWRHYEIAVINLRAYFSKEIVVVSQEMKDRYVRYWNYPKHKVKVGYHGVDVARFSPAMETFAAMRLKVGIPSSDIVFITTARLTAQKCLHRAIDAFDALCRDYPNLRLVMAGNGPLETELKALAKSKSSHPRIVFLGHVDNPGDYLKMSNIFVLSSDNEGLSLAFLEAMATGLICVSTTCTGANEVLQNGINGFLVDKNTDAVYRGMRTVLDLPVEARETISQAARQFVVDKFEINKNARSVLSSFGIATISPAYGKPNGKREHSQIMKK